MRQWAGPWKRPVVRDEPIEFLPNPLISPFDSAGMLPCGGADGNGLKSEILREPGRLSMPGSPVSIAPARQAR